MEKTFVIPEFGPVGMLDCWPVFAVEFTITEPKSGSVVRLRRRPVFTVKTSVTEPLLYTVTLNECEKFRHL
jgi:hypothetical protein